MKVKGLHEHKLMENGSQSKEIKYKQKRCNILLEWGNLTQFTQTRNFAYY